MVSIRCGSCMELHFGTLLEETARETRETMEHCDAESLVGHHSMRKRTAARSLGW